MLSTEESTAIAKAMEESAKRKKQEEFESRLLAIELALGINNEYTRKAKEDVIDKDKEFNQQMRELGFLK